MDLPSPAVSPELPRDGASHQMPEKGQSTCRSDLDQCLRDSYRLPSSAGRDSSASGSGLYLREMFTDAAERFWRDTQVRGEHPLRHLERDARVSLQELEITLLDRHAQRVDDSAILRRRVLLERDAKHGGKRGNGFDHFLV